MNNEDDNHGVSPEEKLRDLYARINGLDLEGNWPAARQLARDACEIAGAVYGPHDPQYVHACNVLERLEGQSKLRATPVPRRIELIPCAACGQRISEEAEACPQCGHPQRSAQAKRLQCHACSASATTRCQSCNALSCPEHLKSIYVRHNRGGAYELRCASCYASAEQRRLAGLVILLVLAGIGLIFLMAVASMSQSGFPR